MNFEAGSPHLCHHFRACLQVFQCLRCSHEPAAHMRLHTADDDADAKLTRAQITALQTDDHNTKRLHTSAPYVCFKTDRQEVLDGLLNLNQNDNCCSKISELLRGRRCTPVSNLFLTAEEQQHLIVQSCCKQHKAW